MRKVEDASEKAVTKVFAGTSKTKAATQTASKSTPKADLWSKYSDKKVDTKKHLNSDDPYSGKSESFSCQPGFLRLICFFSFVAEAHDLINGWVADKIRFDMDDDFYNYVDVQEVNKFTTTEKYLDKIRKEIMADEEENGMDIVIVRHALTIFVQIFLKYLL